VTEPLPPGGVIGANPSFVDLVRKARPEALPMADAAAGELRLPHGTTVLGLKFADGVVLAGDRRATSGNLVADAKIRKVFAADDRSAIAIAGAAGQALEIVKLFQLELEHYEKITGDRLSLEGKANRLAQMIRQNLPAAMRLVVIHSSAGSTTGVARSDLLHDHWGRWEKTTTRQPARAAPAKLPQETLAPRLDRAAAIAIAVEALIDASEDDTSTGGPDSIRGIFPNVVSITTDGAEDVQEADVAAAVEAVLQERSA
jgi:proteasome beta subunit